MTERRYFGQWADENELRKEFAGYGCDPIGLPLGTEILFASYEYVSYEGMAWVIFTDGMDLYEVHGSHCSCNGLEGQWQPEKTSWEFVAKELYREMSQRYYKWLSPEAQVALLDLVTEHVPFPEVNHA